MTQSFPDNPFLRGAMAPSGIECAAEGDGYILMLAYDQTTALSQLMVFDAQDIEAGPLAKARMPVRIPSGFHGSWVGA